MLPGLLWWGAGFAGLTFGLGWPGRAGALPGYALYLGVCLVPLNVLLLRSVARRPRHDVTAFLVQAAVVVAVTYPVQIAATLAGAWAYFEDRDRLLGIRMGGVPVEEFFFYPLTINLALWLYLELGGGAGARVTPPPAAFRRWCRVGAAVAFGAAAWCGGWGRDLTPDSGVDQFRDALGTPHFSSGVRDRGWTLVELVSVGVNLLLLEWLVRRTALSRRALVPAAAVFFIICFLSDLLGTSRGWWVFNARKVSGWWVGPVPVENLPAYLTGLPLSVGVYEATRRWLGARA